MSGAGVNDGEYTVSSVAATVLTLAPGDTVATAAAAAGITVRQILPEPIDADGDFIPEDSASRFAWNIVTDTYPATTGWGTSDFVGDGNTQLAVPINMDADPDPEQVLRFSMGNNLGKFSARLFDADGADITPAAVDAGAGATPRYFTAAGQPLLAVRDPRVWVRGNPNIGFTHHATNPDTITRSTGDWTADGFTAGQWITVTGAGANNGNYEIDSVTASTIELVGGTVLTAAAATGGVSVLPYQYVQTEGQVGLRASGANRLVGSGLEPLDRALFHADDFRTTPYVANAVDNARMLLGAYSLYESTDRLETVTPIHSSTLALPLPGVPLPNVFGGYFSALAYGGFKGTTPHADVIYAIMHNSLFVRPAGGTLQSYGTISGAGVITDIVLDPTDWETAYVTDSQRVYQTTDHGQNWTVISDKLGLTGMNGLEMVETSGGDKALFVSTPLGVYRALNPAADVEWTEFGRGLPNAVVTDVHFYDRPAGSSDVLLAATLGRGTWTVYGNISTLAGQESVLSIEGTDADDEIRLERRPSNPAMVDAYVNDVDAPAFSLPLGSFDRIEVSGLGGDDTLTVNTNEGAITAPGGIVFVGGADNDTLVLEGGKITSSDTETLGAQTIFTFEDHASEATQKLIYESVETVDNNLPEASILERIGAGFEDFFEWLGLIGNPGEGIETELAVIGGSLPRALAGTDVTPAVPITDKHAAPLAPAGLDLAPSDSEGLRRLIETGLGGFDLDDIGGSISTYEALRTALDGLDTADGNVTFLDTLTFDPVNGDPVDGEVRFEAQVLKRLDGAADFDVDFDLFGGNVDLNGMIGIDAAVELNLIFGLDAGGFFFDTSGDVPELRVRDLNLAGEAAAAGRFGFLDVEVATEEFTVSEDVGLEFDAVDPGGDGVLRLADLGFDLGDKMAVAVTGDPGEDDVLLRLSAEASAMVSGVDAIGLGGAEVTLTWADVSNPTGVEVAASGGLGQDLIDFLHVDVESVLDQIEELTELASSLSETDVPLFQGGLSGIIEMADFISEKIIDPLTSGASGEAGFGSIQNLITRLAREAGVDPSELGLNYDSGSKELTWQLDLSKTFTTSDTLSLDFDLEAGLADFDFSTVADIDADVDLTLTVGIDLGSVVAGGDPGDWLFIRDASATASLDTAAQDVDASARFGFVSIEVVDGTADANARFEVEFTDPGTNAADGRIDIGELLDGLNDLNTLIDVSLSGSANFDLPISAPFLGIAPSPDTMLGIHWTDLSDPNAVDIVLPSDLGEMGNFSNMNAGTFVGLLGRISNWLEELRGGFNVVDVPFVGQELDQVLQFADTFSDTLLYDDLDDDDDETGIDGLLDVNNQPTFDTVQEMIVKLVEIFGAGDYVEYDAAEDTLTIELSLGDVGGISNFGRIDVPIDFSLLDLAPLAEVYSDSQIRLSAGGGLTMTIGVYLGDAGAVVLTDNTPLSSLKDGIEFSDSLVIAAPQEVSTVYGRLSKDSTFQLSHNGAAPVTIQLPLSATENNAALADLAADLSAAIGASALAGLVAAGVDNKGTPNELGDDQIMLSGAAGTTSLEFAAAPGDPAVREIGFAAGQTAEDEDGTFVIRATVPGLVGRPADDAAFFVALSTVNGGVPMEVIVPAERLRGNRNILDVVADVQRTLDAAGFEDRIEVGSRGKRLVFQTLEDGVGSFLIAASGVAATELGLPSGQYGTSVDLVVTTGVGLNYNVVLDGAGTLGQVIGAIESATGNTVDVQYSDGDTRLLLVDNSGGTNPLLVENAFGSTAASDLGIVRAFVVPPTEGDDSPPIDRIEGGLLGGVDPMERLFLQNTQAAANLHFSTPDGVDAAAKFGFVGIEATGNAGLNGTFEVGLKPSGSAEFDPQARITLKDLVDNIDSLDSFITGPTIGGTGDLTFGIEITPAFPAINTGAAPSLTIDILDLGGLIEGAADAYEIRTEGFDTLLNFSDVGFGDVVAALRALVDFLQQFEELGFMSEKLPVIDVSIDDVLGFAEEFEAALDEIEANPAGTVQVLESKLKEALQIPRDSDLLELDVVEGNILRIDVNFEPSFSESLPVSLDLPIASGIVDLSGKGDLRSEGNLDIELAVGVDLDDLDRFWVFEDTGISGNLSAVGDDIAFTAALGGIGARILGGEAEITGQFGLALRGDAMTAGEGDARRALLTDLLANLGGSVDADLSGGIVAALPVYFPSESQHRGDIELGGSLSLTPTGGLDVIGTLGGGEFLVVPDDIFNVDFSQFSALDSLGLIVDGVDSFLGLLQDTFNGEVAGFTLPLIGDQLEDVADVIETFRTDFVDGLRDAFETVADPDENYVSQQLFELLNSELGILADRNDDGFITVADVGLDTNIDEPGVDPDDVYMQWNLKLGGSVVDAGAGLDFDLGIPGLGFETRGAIAVEVPWELDLGFGVGVSRGGFYIDLSDTNEFEVAVDVTLPGAGLTGQLAFLQLDADDNGDTHLCAKFGVDVSRETPGGTIDPSDPRHPDHPLHNLIGMADLGSIVVDAGIAAEAVVDIGLDLQLNSDLVPGADTVFPKIVGDFFVDWSIGSCVSGELTPFSEIGNAMEYGLNAVEFRDIGVDLGTFISDFVGPIVGQVKDFTEPLQPLIDVFTAPIPVISDLAGSPVTLVDIAGAFGYVEPGLIYAIDDLITLVNSIPDPGSVGSLILPYGDFPIYGRGTGQTPDLWDIDFDLDTVPLPSIDAGDIRNALDGLETDPGSGAEVTKSFTNGLADKSFGDFISFPIFDNPSQVFGLLMGKDASLIEVDLPPLDFNFTYSQFFPIFGPLGASITGTVGALIDPPAFGYDTLGLSHFADAGFRDPSSLFDGLFLASDEPIVVLSGGISAAAEVNLAVARAGVAGGIFVGIDFMLHDPNEDGKVRLNELVTNVLNEAKYGEPALAPLAMFDVSGELYAKLFAFIYIDLLFFSLDWEQDITPEITLLDFDIPFTRKPTLATELSGGVLRLNTGEFAGERLEGDDRDGSEQFYVTQVDSDTVKVWSPSLGVAEDEAQEYDVSDKIIVLGGRGDDTIDLSGVTNPAISFEIEGGAGNDVIILGAGPGRVDAGAGDDHIEGSDGDDVIIAGLGNDFVDAKGGNDVVFGDETKIGEDGLTVKVSSFGGGGDVLIGGGGDDLIFGGGGIDFLGGDLDPRNPDGGDGPVGNDFIVGDGGLLTLGAPNAFRDVRKVQDTDSSIGGADVIFGHRGNDTIYAGGGNDQIEGGSDHDTIWAEGGFDTVDAGSGDDTVHGGADRDVILAGPGQDHIYGDGGNDDLRGQSGPDEIHGGPGVDEIHGGDENDTIFGNSEPDVIYGGLGIDVIDGGSGADTIYGQEDGDVINGGLGDDMIDGGGDDDVIYGHAGSDYIIGGPGRDTIYAGVSMSGGGLPEDVNRIWGEQPEVATFPGDPDEYTDTIYGDVGRDIIDAGPGHDTVHALSGNNEIHGRAGNNTITSGLGNDIITAEDGNDTVETGDGRKTIDVGEGTNFVTAGNVAVGTTEVISGSGIDTITIGEGTKRVLAGAGDNVITLGDGDAEVVTLGGNDTVEAGDGQMTIDVGEGTNFVNAGSAAIGMIEVISGSGVDTITIGEGTKRVLADAGDNVITLGDGDAEVVTLGGNDTIVAGTGTMTISADAGDNIVRLADGAHTVTTLDGIDTIETGDGADIILAGDGDNTIDSGGGNDFVQTGDGIDTINGGAGNDIILAGTEDDWVYAGDDADLIVGDYGDDHLYGQGGRDVVLGRPARRRLGTGRFRSGHAAGLEPDRRGVRLGRSQFHSLGPRDLQHAGVARRGRCRVVGEAGDRLCALPEAHSRRIGELQCCRL